ncbi:DUF1641 domain-containing protein [Streptomyces bottropensis]|uniref:DUF1641 domain-containing protein n=1 Tax=Streptomyces bottropensis ATCC 25435 TaxID=1054862 RepID=M3DJR4_9ACTN|nr:DUF1641 domain-containing protein [Streptomyces bottropensis]EMF57077.1 hypothetical protein SBD_1613 [Streptomyces bottropensis ATCC 25435]MZD20393.1 DUF1641 domain-containing protein [Streptomyces sp. SID5476]
MTVIESALDPDPVEALVARLEEPNVAGALHELLNHADLLAILIHGVDGLMSRSDTISDSLADAVTELRQFKPAGLPEASQMIELARQLSGLITPLLDVLPRIEDAVRSDVGGVGFPDIVAAASRAAVRGTRQAASEQTQVNGLRALLRVVKDPDVGRAIGFVVAIAKALGQELKALDAAAGAAAR